MKKTIAIMATVVAAGAMSASAALLVAFDEVTGNPDGGNTQTANYTETGFAATYVTDSNNFGATTSGGLANSTYGTYDASGEHTNLGDDHLSLNNGLEGGINFTISNTSGSDWNLNTFHFDIGHTRPGAADVWTLSVVSGGLTAGVVGSGGPGANGGSATAAWNDNDQSLTGLADYTLENGASVVFLLDIVKDSTQGPSGHHTYIDNFAITGTVIPEPATLGLVAAFGGAVLFIRRRFMI